MSSERPSRGNLTFQCDACFDTREFSKSEGDDVNNFKTIWAILHEDGWTMSGTDHLCEDCTKIAKADRANPFRR